MFELLSLKIKLLTFFIVQLQNAPIKLDLKCVVRLLNSGSRVLGDISVALLILSGLILLIEIINRVRYDSLLNLPKSMRGTFKMRRLLIHREAIKKDDEHPQINQTVEKYNKAVKHSMIDVLNSKFILYLKPPKEYQAQKMLKEMEAEIKEEIASTYPDYLISTFEREKNSLWLKGTRK